MEAARTARILEIDPAIVVFETDGRRRAVRLAAAQVAQSDREAERAKTEAAMKKK